MATIIDHEGPDPVYRQLANILRARILRGEIEPDRPLPSETGLQEEYGVEREDVRRAIQVLSGEGLVYTIGDRVYVSSRAEETGGG